MKLNGNPREAAKGPLMGALDGLSVVASAAISFLLTPFVYNQTIAWIQRYVGRSYGEAVVDIATLAWWVIVGLLIYFVGRIGTLYVFVIGGSVILVRLLN
ncbi:MAG: hypothetical protein AAF720_02580 [Pseudomonadota bacterium]